MRSALDLAKISRGNNYTAYHLVRAKTREVVGRSGALNSSGRRCCGESVFNVIGYNLTRGSFCTSLTSAVSQS
jgi:curli biogenesis system outer membrane secretion channel CsgG